MKSRALNSDNDLIVENDSLKVIDESAQVVQHVRTRLLFYLEEWFLDLNAGTPWMQQVFIKPVNLANVESIIKQRILQTPEVDSLNTFSMNFDSSSRGLSVSFSANTIYGIIEVSEVTINV